MADKCFYWFPGTRRVDPQLISPPNRIYPGVNKAICGCRGKNKKCIYCEGDGYFFHVDMRDDDD
jgi:hypothetical protein